MGKTPAFQSALRVTKYDPALRNASGAFTGDDWISVSDVGDNFAGEPLTLPRYLDIEARHLRVVAAFLAEAAVETTVARGVESYDARWWPAEGERLSQLETLDVVREMLRERGFCRLAAGSALYIHVGYDYYLYLGGNVRSEMTIALAAEIGLFVDHGFTSPYHLNPATGEYF